VPQIGRRLAKLKTAQSLYLKSVYNLLIAENRKVRWHTKYKVLICSACDWPVNHGDSRKIKFAIRSEIREEWLF
jgi:RNase P subunit RPR2